MSLIETLAVKAGPMDRYNSDVYLPRDIMCTGLALAVELDEFHKDPIVYAMSVERLVRHLIVMLYQHNVSCPSFISRPATILPFYVGMTDSGTDTIHDTAVLLMVSWFDALRSNWE